MRGFTRSEICCHKLTYGKTVLVRKVSTKLRTRTGADGRGGAASGNASEDIMTSFERQGR